MNEIEQNDKVRVFQYVLLNVSEENGIACKLLSWQVNEVRLILKTTEERTGKDMRNRRINFFNCLFHSWGTATKTSFS